MLEEQKLDALYVCLPPGAHCGQAEAAAARGIHLMLEKPIALTMQRAESIRAAVKKAGVLCEIGHHWRHTAPVRRLKGMLEDGSAGRPLMMQGRFFVNALFPAWWRDPAMGGGQLIEQAIHVYDLARHFLGEAQTISAFVDGLNHQRFPDYRVDDVSASVIRFRNGAIASICGANCAEPCNGSVTSTVLCQNVMVEFRSPDEATFIYHGGKVSEEIAKGEGKVTREEVKNQGNNYELLGANFISDIRGQEQLRSSVDDGVEDLRLVLAAAESSRADGTPQRLT